MTKPVALNGLRLTPWDIIQLNRKEHRPQLQDYMPLIFKETREIHGDRAYGDDQTMYTGLASLNHPSTGTSNPGSTNSGTRNVSGGIVNKVVNVVKNILRRIFG